MTTTRSKAGTDGNQQARGDLARMASRLEAKHRDSPYLVGMAFTHASEGPMGRGGRSADLFSDLGSACAGRDVRKVDALLGSLKDGCACGSFENANASLARLDKLVGYGRTHYNADVFGALMAAQAEVGAFCQAMAREADHPASGTADASLVEAAKNGDLLSVKRHYKAAGKEAKAKAMELAVGDKEPYFDLAVFAHPHVVRYLADMK